jgi:RNase P protein component
MTMNIYPNGWDFNAEACPCDRDFSDYLEEKAVRGKSVFHFGSGLHHTVGLRCHEMDNAVLAITASTEEIEAYVKLAVERPSITRTYKAFFGDIYLLDPRLLPKFDIVFLPHLSEYTPQEEGRVQYGQMDDRAMLDMLMAASNPGALFVFYRKSRRFNKAEPIIKSWAEASSVGYLGENRTLSIYQLPGTLLCSPLSV